MEHPLLAAHTSVAPVRGGVRGHLLNAFLRGYLKRKLARVTFSDQAVADMRQRMERLARRAGRLPHAVSVSQTRIAGVPVEVIEPQTAQTAPTTVLYCHGGAFVAGSPRTHRSLTTAIAVGTGARVLVPDYRLAPEHRYPAAHDDISAVYQALVEKSGSQRLALAGDSAGGNLVLATLLRARASGVALPEAAVAFSPWGDLTGSGQSVHDNMRRDAMLPAQKIALAARLYAPDAALDAPELSPVFADFAGLPPLLLHAGTTEILLDDSARVLIAAREAGVRAHLRLWQDLPHVFQIFERQLPAARSALMEATVFLRTALAGSVPDADPVQPIRSVR